MTMRRFDRKTGARPRTRVRDLKRVGGLAMLAVLSACPSARAADPGASADYPAVAILTATARGQGVLFRNPDGKPNCLVLTSAHVAHPGDDIQLVGSSRTSDKPTSFRAKAGVKEEFIDAQLSVLRPDIELVDCPPLRVGNINASLARDGIARTRYFNEATGETIFSRIVLESATVDTLEAASIGARRVQPGFSGGLVTQDGQPLGVVQKVDGRGVVLASRLDFSRVFVGKYASIPDAPVSNAWDVSFLPPEYQAIFTAAVDMRKEAEAAQRIARQNALDANDAQMRARAGSQNHAEIEDTGGVYRGQTDSRGWAIGAGVRTITSGDSAGNQLSGRWRLAPDSKSTGLFGYGVVTYERIAANGNDNRSFEGELANGEPNGAGVLQKVNGDTWFAKWTQGISNSITQFYRVADGALFMAKSKDGTLDGPGLLWSKDGQLLAVGIWKQGSLVDDKTAVLTRRK